MKQALDRFILGFPLLFLKQYPYAWLAAVTLWPRSRSFALLFLAIILFASLCLRWQSAAWISQMQRLHAGANGKFYMDQPPIPWKAAWRKIAILILGSPLIAFLLQGQFGLTFWQVLVIVVGFTILHQDTLFFGASVTYIITATGIAIRFIPGHIDYTLFLPFKEISCIERRDYKKSMDTDLFARTRDVQNGLLMTPKDPKGFTKRIHKLFIAPGNVEKFMEQLPYGYR